MKRNIMISVTLLSLLCSCSSNITGISTEESQITNIPSQTDDSSRGSNYRTCPDEKDDFILQVECPTPKSIYDKFQFNLYCAHGWKTDEDDFSHYPDDIESWKFKIIFSYAKVKWKNNNRQETLETGHFVVAEIPDFLSVKYDVPLEYQSNPNCSVDITLKESIEVELDSNIFKISNEEYESMYFYIWPFDSNNEEISRENIPSIGSTGDELWFLNDGENVTFYKFYPSNIINGREK